MAIATLAVATLFDLETPVFMTIINLHRRGRSRQ